jgi:hypothetical protein
MFPVYGATPQADPRYQHEKDEYDEMNMTQMTNNLNATNVSHLKKPSVGGGKYDAVLTTDGGDETFDIEAIQRQHKGRKDPTGQSMNIFNTSSAGSVKMRNYLGEARGDQFATATVNKGINNDQSVSMCKMEDSVAFDLGAKPINGTLEASSPPQYESRRDQPSDTDYQQALLADDQK